MNTFQSINNIDNKEWCERLYYIISVNNDCIQHISVNCASKRFCVCKCTIRIQCVNAHALPMKEGRTCFNNLDWLKRKVVRWNSLSLCGGKGYEFIWLTLSSYQPLSCPLLCNWFTRNQTSKIRPGILTQTGRADTQQKFI